MSWMTGILFVVSTGLLVPVVLGLLVAFVASLWLLGGFYRVYINRLFFKKRLKPFLHQAAQQGVKRLPVSSFDGPDRFFQTLQTVQRQNWHVASGEKALSDYEIVLRKGTEFPRTLMRVGPMLGLMGTLIPMGPALTGLAAGDIAAMAGHLQVAFSTTVVGVFVGMIGFVIQLIKHRWAAEDLNHLEYLWNLSQEEKDEKTPVLRA